MRPLSLQAYARYLVEAPDVAVLDAAHDLFLPTHGQSWSVDLEGGTRPVFFGVGAGGGRSPGDAGRRPAVLHFNSHDGGAMLDALLPYVDGGAGGLP